MAAVTKTIEEVLVFVKDVVGRNLGVPSTRLQPDDTLERYGIDSLQWANIAYELSIWNGRQMSPEEAASCGTVSGLATALTRA